MLANLRAPFAALTLLAVAVIGFVLFAQYVQDYQPCELCLRERLPWYLAVALGLGGLAFPSRRLLVLLGLTLLVSAGFGLHHAGVEQHWWPGPAACTGGASGAKTIDELRAMMLKQKVVQCDAIAWTLFGLSMAAYNFILSLAVAVATLILAIRGRHAR